MYTIAYEPIGGKIIMGLIGLLFPFIVVFGLIGLVVFSFNQLGSRRNKYIHRKNVYWMLGGYVVVLLISTVLFLSIPIQPNTHFAAETDHGYPYLESITSQELLDKASNFIVNEKQFSYEKDYLNIHLNTSEDRYHHFRVLVERKNENDQMIEAVIYQTPTFINDWNITEYIEPIDVDVSLSALLIDNIWKGFSYASFKPEFPFSQFDEDRQPMFEGNIRYGQELLFLRIPKDVDIIDKENVEIVYLND